MHTLQYTPPAQKLEKDRDVIVQEVGNLELRKDTHYRKVNEDSGTL